MPEYLSKEEIRQWRSSLERITLEQYAARLGKVVQGEKSTNDMIDKVMSESLNSFQPESYNITAEKLQSIALKSFEKEKQIQTAKPVTPEKDETTSISEKIDNAKKSLQKNIEEKEKKQTKTGTKRIEIYDNLSISFKKNLTSREQLIFEYFLAHKNSIVYAKDLAKILELPRDYVYKYIKNLRTKLNEDILHNADNGGYMLKI